MKVAKPASRMPSVAPARDRKTKVGLKVKTLTAFGRSLIRPKPLALPDVSGELYASDTRSALMAFAPGQGNQHQNY